jgi:hypothetical protein
LVVSGSAGTERRKSLSKGSVSRVREEEEVGGATAALAAAALAPGGPAAATIVALLEVLLMWLLDLLPLLRSRLVRRPRPSRQRPTSMRAPGGAREGCLW